MPSEKERLQQILKRMNEIMNLSDQECDSLEAEFKKANIMK